MIHKHVKYMEFTVQDNNNNIKVALRRYVQSHSFHSVEDIFGRNTVLKRFIAFLTSLLNSASSFLRIVRLCGNKLIILMPIQNEIFWEKTFLYYFCIQVNLF